MFIFIVICSSWWNMVFFHWIGSLDLVTAKKCGNADYKEQRSVLMEGGLLQEKGECAAKFYVVGNLWTFF
jgi:hypothetical protein